LLETTYIVMGGILDLLKRIVIGLAERAVPSQLRKMYHPQNVNKSVKMSLDASISPRIMVLCATYTSWIHVALKDQYYRE